MHFFAERRRCKFYTLRIWGSINAVVSLCKTFPFYTLHIVYYIPSLLDD